MKKIVCFVLSFLMAVVCISAPLSAFAAENSGEISLENPLYSGAEIPKAVLASDATKESKVKYYGKKAYYSEGKQLYTVVRDNLEKRNTSFTVRYLSSSYLNSIFAIGTIRSLLQDMYFNATEDELSESSTDGDYIRWAVSGLNIDNFHLDETKSGYYYYTFDVRYSYYDSAEQEKEVDKVVKKFVSSVDTSKLTDYEIIKKVHDFICSRTTYNYDAVDSPRNNTEAFTAYGALVSGKCVCQGYAVAFYRLCKELGYNVRFVSSDPNRGCHAWNIVELDGKYYFVDCTWDDQIIDEELEEFEDNYYLLINYDNLKANDGSSGAHILEEDYYGTKYFRENYRNKLDEEDYDVTNETLFSQYTVSLSNYNYSYSGKMNTPTVIVKNKNGEVLQSGTDYRLTYSKNKNTGAARVNIKGAGKYATTLTRRQFTIIPAKTATPALESGGRSTSSLNIKWNKSAGAVSGYSIEQYKNGKWMVIKNVDASKTSYTVKGLSPATVYSFRVRAYKNIYKTANYGAYSNVYKTATKPKTVSKVTLTGKKNAVKVQWKKAAGSKYEIQYSTQKNMKGAKTVKVSSSKVNKTIKKLKKGKTYYVRIRSYKKYKTATGKTKYVYGSWSSKKSAKVK